MEDEGGMDKWNNRTSFSKVIEGVSTGKTKGKVEGQRLCMQNWYKVK